MAFSFRKKPAYCKCTFYFLKNDDDDDVSASDSNDQLSDQPLQNVPFYVCDVQECGNGTTIFPDDYLCPHQITCTILLLSLLINSFISSMFIALITSAGISIVN